MSKVFFIVSCHRSGSTALANILNTASNAEVFVEASPKLLVESRELILNRVTEPEAILRDSRQHIIEEVCNRGNFFGDKSPIYASFLPYLLKIWDAKIIYLHRDGRDVVRSLMDWHKFQKPVIYAREEDGSNGPDLPPEKDPWGYMLLRPTENEPLFNEWKSISRFEKCAWYWSKYNQICLDNIARLDSGNFKVVSATCLDTKGVKEIFNFLKLQGFDSQRVNKMLSKRINSVQDRFGLPDHFPDWKKWTNEQNSRFKLIASNTMMRLGYFF